MTAEDKKRDRYYFRKYGITLAEYKAMLAAQDNACGICKQIPEPDKKNLAVDHCHKHRYLKIAYMAVGGNGICAFTTYRGRTYDYVDKNRRAATKGLRQKLKKASCRGILCWKCNLGLQKWRDNPSLMRSAAEYLERHQLCPTI